MTWRVAKSLLTLRDQVNALYPGRSKSSDGTIGDERHQATTSDHNPDANGIVTAMDITNDPAHGLVSRKLAESLVASRDPRIKYIISNAQIISSKVQPWVWRPYTGSNAHTEHVHVSVIDDPALYDDQRPWELEPVAMVTTPSQTKSSGKGSWYSQFQGKYSWKDPGDAANSNALGVPDSKQGIAFYDKTTLGKWFNVTAPNGKTLLLQQTDIGPAPKTGRLIDISARAADAFGYSPSDFPTDGTFSWEPAAAPAGLENMSPQQQAAAYEISPTSKPVPPPATNGAFPLTQEQFMSVIRWLLAVGGPFLIANGYATDSVVAQIGGAVMAIAPLIWSMITKTRSGIIATAASLPDVQKIVTTPEIADGTLKADPKVVAR